MLTCHHNNQSCTPVPVVHVVSPPIDHSFITLFNIVFTLIVIFFFFFNDTATTEIYTLSLHDALPICWSVDIKDPGVEIAHCGKRHVDVAGVDRRRQAVGDPVADGNRLIQRSAAHHRYHRTEDFLLGDPHPRIDIGKHRRFVKPSVRVRAGVEAAAPGHQPRPFASANLDVFHDRLELRFAHRGSYLRSLVEAITDPQRAGPRGKLTHKRVVHSLVHDDAACRRTALPGRPESTPETPFDRQVELRVVHDDDDVLTAHLEVNLLET